MTTIQKARPQPLTLIDALQRAGFVPEEDGEEWSLTEHDNPRAEMFSVSYHPWGGFTLAYWIGRKMYHLHFDDSTICVADEDYQDLCYSAKLRRDPATKRLVEEDVTR